ncbi:MAG TPA: MFS transporter [Chitinophagales bacterium]|nr:MFS transporter [Chitinophagales bacterium]
MRLKYITRPVLVLSLVSLFTDMASEMLYPVMPVYLESIGFSILLIGVLEGVAETTAGLSKGYFGQVSDLTQKRLPFVRLGYLLSAVSKPMMAAFTYPLWIFFARTTDRFGKGLRTGARDAMLSDASTRETKARIFGFHRGMDTFGAVLGPLIALIYLYFFPGKYIVLFLIAFAPGIISVAMLFLLKEKKTIEPPQKKPGFLEFLNYVRHADPAYKKLLGGLLLFALFNSTDILLLLKMKQSGMEDTLVIGIYIFYNLVYALFSFPAGIIADKIGIKTTFIAGLIIYALVYFGFAFLNVPGIFWILFLLYGVYAAATEGISKAWISLVASKQETATALGAYGALNSICAFVASSLAGLIWFTVNAELAFGLTAVVSVFVILYFSKLHPPQQFVST